MEEREPRAGTGFAVSGTLQGCLRRCPCNACLNESPLCDSASGHHLCTQPWRPQSRLSSLREDNRGEPGNCRRSIHPGTWDSIQRSREAADHAPRPLSKGQRAGYPRRESRGGKGSTQRSRRLGTGRAQGSEGAVEVHASSAASRRDDGDVPVGVAADAVAVGLLDRRL